MTVVGLTDTAHGGRRAARQKSLDDHRRMTASQIIILATPVFLLMIARPSSPGAGCGAGQSTSSMSDQQHQPGHPEPAQRSCTKLLSLGITAVYDSLAP